MSAVARLIKTKLRAAGTDALTYLNDCSRVVRDKTFHGYIGDLIPADIDAISLGTSYSCHCVLENFVCALLSSKRELCCADGYCPQQSNGCTHAVQERSLVQNLYQGSLFPHLRPHQRVFIVPGLFAASNVSAPFGGYRSMEDADKSLCSKLQAFIAWAHAEPRIIGVMPYHLDSWCDGPYTSQCRGAKEFPRLLTLLGELGRNISRRVPG